MRSILLSAIVIFATIVSLSAQRSVRVSVDDVKTIVLKYSSTNIKTEIAAYRGGGMMIETLVVCNCPIETITMLEARYSPKTATSNGTMVIEPMAIVQPLTINGASVALSVTHKIMVSEDMFKKMNE